MLTSTETIATKSGGTLLVEKRAGANQIELSVRTGESRKCLLHWGVQQESNEAWQLPPTTFWPEGTRQVGNNAVQTPFARRNGERSVVIKLASPPAWSGILFALFFPERGRWDNNGGRNYRIEIPKPERSHSALEDAFKEAIGQRKALFQRRYDVESDGQLAVAVIQEGDGFGPILLTDIAGPLILHWGIARYSSYEWFFPPVALQPPGTLTWHGTAQTPFTSRPDGLNELRLVIPGQEAPAGIQFVLKQSGTGRWLNERGANFYIPVSTAAPKATGLEVPELAVVAQEIIKAETGGGSWTLMHRFNLCHELLDRVTNSIEGLALLFVWLRFSAIRQLTWQRNYNTKPRELSHAQDRLTRKLAELCRLEPRGRPLVRLMLTTLGRGGEGQQIRDEILNIMHRHHIKEVSGHFLEEWHQKRHNNTTPDDIVVCEAYLEFLRANGDLDCFYQRLQTGGVTKARLENFERPIRSHPDFVPHLKEALIHDFENFLRILKSVHTGTDLETAINTARTFLDAGLQNLLSGLWDRRNDSDTFLGQFVERITEARRRLRPRLSVPDGIRESLYLDLALEQFLRVVVERNIHLHLGGDLLVDLVGLVLENLTLSQEDAELPVCSRHWDRLKKQPRFGQDWSLHAKSVLDRIGRVLSELIDRTYRLLQPKAELLGHAFHADAWTVTLFSEEVVRGSSLGFLLSLLLHHLDPLLRQAAQLGKWQIISHGAGSGTVEVAASLRAIQGRTFDSPRIIVAEKVMGDEAIPDGVVAVVAPDVTDIVSHVAVRARNSNLLFATCHDPGLFNQLKALAGRHLSLSINAAGDVVFVESAEESRPVAARAQPVRRLSARPRFTAYTVLAREFDERIVGEKSCNQTRLQGKLPGWIKQPASIALPFGVFERVLSLERNQAVAERYTALERRFQDDPSPALHELRETILDLRAPDDLLSSLRQTVKEAGLTWPANPDDAWTCIKRVWASTWNERAFLSRISAGIPHDDLLMAVLIQQVVEADYAFVIHTVNPLTRNKDELYAEVVPGLGETVVANYPGRALSFAYDTKSGRLTELSYPGKSIALYGAGLIFRSDSNGEDLAGYGGAGLYDSVLLPAPRKVLLDYTQEPLVWDKPFREGLLRRISEMGVEVQRVCRSPQDIEGAMAKGEYYIVQTRPQAGIQDV